MIELLKQPQLADASPVGNPSLNNPVLNEKLQDILVNRNPTEFFAIILPNIVGLSFVIGVVIFLFVVAIGAIQWTISGGDKTAIESARGKITNAIVGIIILFSLFALLKLIEDFFGINILSLDLGILEIK